MFARKKKGSMLAKRSGSDGPRHLAERDGTGNHRQIVKGTDEVSPRTLAKRGEAADPSKVAQLVLERIENFPETYYQGKWFGKRQKDGSVSWANRGVDQVAKLSGLSASAWSDCGTTGCVAGHTSAVAVELGVFPPTSDHLVGTMARTALNMTWKQEDWLFDATRSQGEVKTALNQIISGKSKKIHKSYGLLG